MLEGTEGSWVPVRVLERTGQTEGQRQRKVVETYRQTDQESEVWERRKLVSKEVRFL